MKILQILRHTLFAVIAFACITGVFVYTFFIKEQETVSLFENRNLATKESIAETSFMDTTFQDSIEDVLADQFYQRQRIVEEKKQFDRAVELVVFGENTDDLVLTKMGDTSIYQLGSSNYMMNGLMTYDENIEKCIMNRIEQINNIAYDYPDIEFYLYRPVQGYETSLFDEINNVESYGEHYNQLFVDHLQIPVDFLDIESVEMYKELFFSSDHHWNYRGAYQGYSDIMNLMGMGNEILEPKSIFCHPNATFYGTYSTRTANLLEPDSYCLYDIDYADAEVIVNNEVIEDILNPKYYIEHSDEYASNPYEYHYNKSFENYTPYVQYRTDKTNKKNILVIGDSYSRAIANYLASSFYNSYFVNPTDYISSTGSYFYYDSFIRDCEIDVVLFMYTIENYFAVDAQWGDIYKNFDVHRNPGE